MNFLELVYSKVHGKRKRKKTNIGTTSREAQASREVAQKGDGYHANRVHDGLELPRGSRLH
jgi:hypothetical protein